MKNSVQSTAVIGVALLRGVGLLAGLITAMLITNNVSEKAAGLFFYAQALFLILVAVSKLGLDQALLKLTAAADATEVIQQKLVTALIWGGLASSLTCFISLLGADNFSTTLLAKPHLEPVINLLLMALPLTVTAALLAGFFQGGGNYYLAVIFQGSGATIALMAAIWLTVELGVSLNEETLAQLYLSGSFLLFCMSLLCWMKVSHGKKILPARVVDKSLWSLGTNFWGIANLAVITQWSAFIIAGAIISEEDLAHFSVANKIAGLISFVLIIFNTVLAPKYAALWKQKKHQEFEYMAKASSRVMAFIAVLLIVLLFIFSHKILTIFGETYEQKAFLPLVILACGHLVNVASGSVGYILSMTGSERTVLKITLLSCLVTVATTILFTSSFGLVGAAVAATLGMIIQNVLSIFTIRTRMGFWPVG